MNLVINEKTVDVVQKLKLYLLVNIDNVSSADIETKLNTSIFFFELSTYSLYENYSIFGFDLFQGCLDRIFNGGDRLKFLFVPLLTYFIEYIEYEKYSEFDNKLVSQNELNSIYQTDYSAIISSISEDERHVLIRHLSFILTSVLPINDVFMERYRKLYTILTKDENLEQILESKRFMNLTKILYGEYINNPNFGTKNPHENMALFHSKLTNVEALNLDSIVMTLKRIYAIYLSDLVVKNKETRLIYKRALDLALLAISFSNRKKCICWLETFYLNTNWK